MKMIVTKFYERPYENPLAVEADAYLLPDFDKYTDIPGWVWCFADDGHCGWVPKKYLENFQGRYKINRTYNSTELTISPGQILDILEEESGFYWAVTSTSKRGWIPIECVLPMSISYHNARQALLKELAGGLFMRKKTSPEDEKMKKWRTHMQDISEIVAAHATIKFPLIHNPF